MEQQIAEVLQQLALQLQTTVEHLWAVLVRQAYVEGIAGLIALIILTLIMVYVIKMFKTWKSELMATEVKKEGRYRTETDYGLWEVIKVCGAVVYAIIYFPLILNIIPNVLTALLNPEFWALQEVFRLLSQ